MASTRSGRVRFQNSPQLPCSSPASMSCVPMAPSQTRRRSRMASLSGCFMDEYLQSASRSGNSRNFGIEAAWGQPLGAWQQKSQSRSDQHSDAKHVKRYGSAMIFFRQPASQIRTRESAYVADRVDDADDQPQHAAR